MPAGESAPTSGAPAGLAEERGRAPGALRERDALRTAAVAAGSELRGGAGSEAALNAHERARLEDVAASAPGHVVERIVTLLGAQTSAAGRAVFVRAVSARARAVIDANAPDHASAMKVLARFAAKLSALDGDVIHKRASVLDRDPKNESTLDAQALWDRRGRTTDVAHDDADGDNDGLLQRFTASCGPTTLQMMLAEADPVFAFAIVDAGLASLDTHDPVATFQRTLLESAGGVALGRVEAFERSRLRNLLGRRVATGALEKRTRNAILAHAQHGAPLSAKAERALDEVRALTAGFPDAQVLARMSSEPWPERDEGIDTEALVELMHTHLTPVTGVRYEAVSCARGQAYRHVDALAQALKHGMDVAIGTDEPPHWMLVTDVKGRKPTREFFVSDPDGGRTAWVAERALLRGTFGAEPFHLPQGKERPYVDTFILPVTPKR